MSIGVRELSLFVGSHEKVDIKLQIVQQLKRKIDLLLFAIIIFPKRPHKCRYTGTELEREGET